MAIANAAKVTGGSLDGAGGNDPLFANMVSFNGDAAYPTGGTAAFKASMQAVIGSGRAPIACVGQDCGGYVPCYDIANDKLKVYEAAADGNPLDEVTDSTDLSAVVFNLLVVSK